MNTVILTGRVTKDCVVAKTKNGKSQCKFMLAVDKEYSVEDGKPKADFIPCVVYGTSADFMGQYIKKGNMVAVKGRWQTGSYEKDGITVYTHECIVEKVQSLTPFEKKKEEVVVENKVDDVDIDFSDMPF